MDKKPGFKINGTIHKSSRGKRDFYAVHVTWNQLVEETVSLHACLGKIYPALGFHKLSYGHDGSGQSHPGYAWGYNGESPTLLSIAILSLYANIHRDDDWRSDVHNSILIKPLANTMAPFLSRHNIPLLGEDLDVEFIKKHYKAFMEEVIAKLPDNWELTYEEIKAWIKKKNL